MFDGDRFDGDRDRAMSDDPIALYDRVRGHHRPWCVRACSGRRDGRLLSQMPTSEVVLNDLSDQPCLRLYLTGEANHGANETRIDTAPLTS
jgi:hypothetical protein